MESETPRLTSLTRYRRPLLWGGPLVILAVAAALYVKGARFVSTEDAYVSAARTEISASVSGRVVEMDVHDNQAVHRGDLLFRLDERDFRTALDQARAHLASERLRIAALQATWRQRKAEMDAASETVRYATREMERQTRLASSGVSSQSRLDDARHALAQAQQKLAATQQDKDNVQAALDNHPLRNVDQHPAVAEARATLQQAELNLSYATVRAPGNGTVTRVEQLQPGDYVKAAAPLFALVSDRDVWVEANFKETDLTNVRPGQSSTVTLDIYPGRTFHGHVESLSPGTGSSFALLPPENATGNWVKVVQRLPVRIHIDDPDPSRPLRTGLSATVRVDAPHSLF